MKMLIDLQGNYKTYTKILPVGATVIGTVSTDGQDPGALVQFADTGKYAQVNQNHVRDIDQTLAAIAHCEAMTRPAYVKNNRPIGRPALNLADPMRPRVINLNQTTVDILKAIGNGNLSAGVRIAADMVKPS